MYQSLAESTGLFLSESMVSLANYMPILLGAFVLLVLGSFFAKATRRVVVRVLESLNLSSAIKKTPVEHFLQNAEIPMKVESIVGTVIYWIIMLVVVQSVVTLLGLDSLSALLAGVLGYIPTIIASVVILFFGVLLAGLVESFVKGALKTIDASSSRFFGKIASYLVVVVALMAAIAELGIANEFILILFVGLVFALSLGLGLALGIGGQDLVRELLKKWYKNS